MLVQLFGDDREGINQEGYEDEQWELYAEMRVIVLDV